MHCATGHLSTVHCTLFHLPSIALLTAKCTLLTVQGSCPGSLPSQPRSPFALHSFYWAVTPFVTIIIKIIIKIFINNIITNIITTLKKDNEPTSLGRLPPLSASPRLNSNPCFLHLIIIWPLASSSSHQQHQHELLTETNYYRASAF